jgi:hypothetical protein
LNEQRDRMWRERGTRSLTSPTEGHITARSLKSNFLWLKFLGVKIRHATHWDRDDVTTRVILYTEYS